MTEVQKVTRDRIVAFAETWDNPMRPDEAARFEGWTAIVTDVYTAPAIDPSTGEATGPEREVVDLVVFYPGQAGIAVVGIERDDTGETHGTWRFRPRS